MPRHANDETPASPSWVDGERAARIYAATVDQQWQSQLTSERKFGQLPTLGVPDSFDDPLPDADLAAWEEP